MSIINLQLYDSQKKQKRNFVPIDSQNIKMYVCGPTVYSTPHIGNARPAVVFDVLSRLLRQIYPKLTYVRNITDVDDKIQQAALKQKTSIKAISDLYTKHYHNDMHALGCERPDIEPKATEHIAEMIELIERLVSRKHAYLAEGHVLFSVASYPEHGALSGREIEKNRAGARVAVADYKKDPEDFILWKPSTEQEPGWDSPWGRGRPGWHIECTAMIFKHLGMPIDIHGGGGDLLFPHHENEQAQGCCSGLAESYVNYWVHNGMIAIEKEKMSKSLGNIVLVKDLLEKFPGEAVRLALLQTHYRQPISWKDALMEDAKNCLDKYYRAYKENEKAFERTKNFSWQDVPKVIQQALLDDLNTPLAIRHWQNLLKELAKKESDSDKMDIIKAIKASSQCLGLGQADARLWFQSAVTTLTPEEIEMQIVERNNARKNKDFAKADAIRDSLAENNIYIEDKQDNTTWYYQAPKK